MRTPRFFLAFGVGFMIFIFGTALAGWAFAGTTKYKIGDTTVNIVVSGNGGWTMVALHENESTSVRAAKAVMAKTGGRLVELKHSGKRRVSFSLKGKKYSVDPNRMFTDAGIKRDLKPYTTEGHQAVKGLAAELLKHIRGRAIVSLHNNTDGSYSINSYRWGGKYASDAADVNVDPAHDPDDFFFVTNRQLFGVMKAAKYNVVLQSAGVTDDGSLSVYMARKGVVYVNVEAEPSHGDVQKRMLMDVLLQ